MMNFFKKRSNAIIIVVVVGLLFTLFGVRRSLNREAAKVEKLFYDGVEGETGIQTYLDNEFKEAKAVQSIASKYLEDEDTAPFRTTYNNLYNAESISKKYDCYARLVTELETLTARLEAADVAANERQYLDTHIQNMKNIQRMIDSSSYNDKVTEFENVTLGAFPANVLKLIVRPNTPEGFNALREG